jgi:hypothetical protein
MELRCCLALFAILMLSGCGGPPPAPSAPAAVPATLGPVMNLPTVGARIQAPMRWSLVQYPGNPNAILQGPKEKGYPPLIEVSVEEAPGDLATYVKEHKARIEVEDKTVKWGAESEATIDGRPASRIEYDWTSKAEPPLIGDVRVRSLQYVIEDKPKFYRISCAVTADAYERYLERFEASAKSFQRGTAGK